MLKLLDFQGLKQLIGGCGRFNNLAGFYVNNGAIHGVIFLDGYLEATQPRTSASCCSVMVLRLAMMASS